jgi:hypothetical protein
VNADGDAAHHHVPDVTAGSASSSSSARNVARGALLEFGG